MNISIPISSIPEKFQPSAHRQIPFRGEYSKLKIIALFAVMIPVLVVWAALSMVVWLPLKVCNALGCKWNLGNSIVDECFDLWISLAFYRSEAPPISPGKGKPVLLVHGYLHNSTAWYKAIEEMREAGCGPIYTIDLGDGTMSGKFWSMHDYAEQVGEKVEQIKQETGSDTVALVGHSMGGVVSCLYATRYAEPNTVTDVVTIGSPMRGSPFAYWLGEGADGREMRVGSPLLDEIGIAMESAPAIRFYSVASKTDGVVPFESALHGKEQMIVEDRGHTSLLRSRKIAQQVASWLKEN
ncbi:MAG TPA: alpha/beta fold hydrolase [Chlamydiales bacterium]|jgi:pimeloyl-ACP methyl ester carboxylesterase|nr:alpha/beta fold hydrolase [Chlamydiales bacterium]